MLNYLIAISLTNEEQRKENRNRTMRRKNGIVDFSCARVSRKIISPGRYGGNICIFFSA